MELENDGAGGRVLRLRLPVAVGSLVFAALLASTGTLWALSLANAEQQIINAVVERRLDKVEDRWEAVSSQLNKIAATQAAILERLPPR